MTETMTPQEHDLAWLELARAEDQAQRSVASSAWMLLHETRWNETNYNSGRYRQRGSDEVVSQNEALRRAIVQLTESPVVSYRGNVLDEYNERVAAMQAATAALLDHEAKYTGWSRYYLVTSSNGLIHRTMRCATCNKGRKLTTFALLPTLSGLDWSHAVDALGPSLCSVCFPEAPVGVVDGPKLPSTVTEVLFAKGPEAFVQAMAEYRAKAAARAAKKAAQAK